MLFSLVSSPPLLASTKDKPLSLLTEYMAVLSIDFIAKEEETKQIFMRMTRLLFCKNLFVRSEESSVVFLWTVIITHGIWFSKSISIVNMGWAWKNIRAQKNGHKKHKPNTNTLTSNTHLMYNNYSWYPILASWVCKCIFKNFLCTGWKFRKQWAWMT